MLNKAYNCYNYKINICISVLQIAELCTIKSDLYANYALKFGFLDYIVMIICWFIPQVILTFLKRECLCLAC